MKKRRPYIPVRAEASTNRVMRPRRELNWPLAIGTVVLILVAAPSLWAWHAFQVSRQSRHMYRMAQELRESGDYARALQLLYRYLVLRPEDAQSRVDYAQLFDKIAQTPAQKNELLDLYARAIGLFPDNLELHLRYAELLLEMGNPVSASQSAQTVLAKEPKNARALRVRALALLDLEQTQARAAPASEVRSACEQAIAANPEDIRLAVRYADYLRSFPSSVERRSLERFADSIVDRMVDNNPNTVDAYVNRYLYRQRYELPNADVDLNLALARFPDHPAVLTLQAARLDAEGKRDEAIAAYRRVLQLDPQQRNAYLGLAAVYRRQKNFAEARSVIREGLGKVGADDFVLQLELAQTLIEEGAAAQATDVVDRLNRFFAAVASQLTPRNRVELEIVLAVLQGDLERSRENLRGAAQHYEFALRRFPAGGGDLRQYQQQRAVLIGLAGIYSQLGEDDRAAAIYRRLAALEPADYRWRLAMAESLRRAGQWVDAVEAYRAALRLQGCPPRAWFDLARLLIRVELAKSAADRNWILFQEAFQQVQNSLGDGFHLRLLQSEYFLAQGDAVNAMDALRRAEEVADQVDPQDRLLLAEVYRRTGQAEKLNRLVEAAASQPAEEGGYAALLLRVEQLWRTANYEAARKAVRDFLPQAQNDEQKARLLAALAELEISIGNVADADTILDEAIALQSDSLDPLDVRAKLLRQRRQWQEHARLVELIRQREGPDGCLWREARALEYLLADQSAPKLREAQLLADEIRTLRPTWPRGFLLAAQLAELRGRVREATDHLEAALRYGDNQPATYEKLIRLLTQQNRLSDAYHYAERFSNYWPNLHQSAIELAASIRAQSGDQAIAEARRNLQANPTEFRAYEQLGTLLLFAGNSGEAKQVFQDAVARFPEEPAGWLGLFAALIATGEKDTAEQTLVHIAAHNLLPPDKLHLTLAQGYELLGKIDEAEMHYLEALRQTPYDRIALRMAVRFFSRLDLDRAQRALETSIQLTDQAAGAKRALAAVLAAKGGEDNWRRAIELLETSEGQDAVSAVANMRLQAVLYARRGSVQNRREAIRILEEIVKSPSQAAVGDYLLLFALYKDAGQLDRAEENLRAAATLDSTNLTVRSMLLETLIEQKKLPEADAFVATLDESAKQLPVFRALLARLRYAQSNTEEAEQILQQLVQDGLRELDPTRKRLSWETAAAAYERLGLLDKAEQLYRQLVAEPGVGKRPLVAFLLRAGRSNQALETALTENPSQLSREDFVLLCSLVAFADPLQEYRERVDQVIADGLIRWGEDAQVLFAVATLSYMRGQVQQAAQLMGRLLQKTPNDVAALNNMALFQAELPDQREQALQTINRAIDLVGPQPNLMDTLGLVQMALGRLDQAELSLNEAIAQSRLPAYLLHLAEVQRRSGKTQEAVRTFQEALRLGLRSQPMHLTDQQMYRNLERLAQE
ncbi:MAG: hypothetical protein KatS3mg109_1739 [Pirellulaceae bacterium]|nr:MAG: hypothetical protein KatS3mg109_1739 [Pirellulaceae bacterium]